MHDHLPAARVGIEPHRLLEGRAPEPDGGEVDA